MLLHLSNIQKKLKDVQGMVKTSPLLLNQINPFADADQPFASLSTSAVASPEIALDLSRAYGAAY